MATENNKVARFLANAAVEIQSAMNEIEQDLSIEATMRVVHQEQLRAQMVAIRAMGLRYEVVAKRD